MRLLSDMVSMISAVEAGYASTRSLAAHLDLSPTTVMRRLDEINEEVGFLLFEKTSTGIVLTSDARSFADDCTVINELMARIQSQLTSRRVSERRKIEVVSPEGLTQCWLLDRLLEMNIFDRNNIDFHTVGGEALAAEATDIRIGYDLTAGLGFKLETLGFLHVIPFASRKLIDSVVPTLMGSGLADCRYVSHQGPGCGADPWFSNFQGDRLERAIENTVTVSESAAIHAKLVNAGAAIGSIPTYAVEIHPDLIGLEKGGRPLAYQRLEICMLVRDTHRALRRATKFCDPIADVTDVIRSAFASERFTFFGEAYVSPPNVFDIMTGKYKNYEYNPIVEEVGQCEKRLRLKPV